MTLFHGDCLEVLKALEANSVDMVLADLPYQTTECHWDTMIPFGPLWEELHRVTKEDSAIVMFCAEAFTARLILSNLENYRYSLVWKKTKVGRFAQAKLRFLNEHEDIAIFSKGKCSANSKIKMRYFPQGLKPFGKVVKDTSHKNGLRTNRKALPDYLQEFTNYPKSVLEFPSVAKTIHPTEKPVDLLSYLIKTFTREKDIVLDPTMGSGSTGEACLGTNRFFIGIEKDAHYFEASRARLDGFRPSSIYQPELFPEVAAT